VKTLLMTAAVLACVSSAANAQYYLPAVCPPGTRLMAGSPYGPQCVPWGPPAIYYGGPVIVAPPPTDAQIIAGTILGIAGMAISAGRRW
jgi:hypothetical protein